ncbi:glycosyltransferase family 2 protein [Candidatus Saccharibacteria bacterium]|nr:glycosyltransferase family 2 protein [Candidatus Saccharibacteria bacterium]
MKTIKPLVTVGIPTYNRNQILLDTIKQLLLQTYESYEVIVADQTEQPAPDTLKAIEALVKKDSRLRYFRITPANLPAARNFIIQKAKGQLILFIDDDIQVGSQFIANHVTEHQVHPEVDVVAGRIVQKGMPLSNFALYFNKYGLPQGTFNCPDSLPCTYFPGGNHSVSIEALKQISGYYTGYQKNAVREESDAAFRLHNAGYKMFFSSKAALIHLSAPQGGSRIHNHQFDNPRFYINDLLFALRTVKIYYLPLALFRRLRIYTGGQGIVVRFRRVVLFAGCFFVALWYYLFNRTNQVAQEVSEIT